MASRRWLGIAKPVIAKKVFTPTAVSPGSVWKLRIGPDSYEYTSDKAVVDRLSTFAQKARAVTDGIVAAIGTSQLGGGSESTIGSVTSKLVNGQWAVEITGAEDGSPLDVEMEVSEANEGSVKVSVLQEGRAARNCIQTLKWPKTPSAGSNWYVGYKEDQTGALAYNVSAATLETALEALDGIGVGNVTVSGSYTAGYTIEFIGALAATDVELLYAWSPDAVGVGDVIYEVTEAGGNQETSWLMGTLDGNSETFLQFTYNEDETSHLFTGAAGAAEILSALNSLESLSGKVEVVANDDGTFTIGAAGLEGLTTAELTVSSPDGSGAPAILKTDGGTTAAVQTVRLTFINKPNMIGTGQVRFRWGGVEQPATISTLDVAAVNSALGTIGAPYSCTSVTKNTGGNIIVELTADDEYVEGIVLGNTSGAYGTYAFNIRKTQEARSALNEIQQIALHNDPDGGTFTLSYGAYTTSPLSYLASAASVEAALEMFLIIGNNLSVSGSDGGPWIVEFTGALAGTDVTKLSGNGSGLTIASESSLDESDTQIPTGPNWWTNAGNWSGGAVPGTNDTAIFDQGSIPCVYGIDGIPVVGAVDVYRTYTGQIGLNEYRDTGRPETLPTHLRFSDKGSKITVRIGLGDDGEGPSLVRMNFDTQEVDCKIPFSQAPNAEQAYTIGVAGDIANLLIGNATVAVALNNGLTATVDALRLAPDADAEGAIVEWGSDATVTYAEVIAGTLRAGSVPTALTVASGTATVDGNGTINQLIVRNATCRYLAGGQLGRQGVITGITLDTGRLRLNSTAHGLSGGDRVFVAGFSHLSVPDGYYTIDVIDANAFALVGTAPAIPYGASDPTGVADYYQPSTLRWGLINTVIVGEQGILDFSEASETRIIPAPVVLQSESAQLLDPQVTIQNLRWHGDPSSMDDEFGLSQIYRRENAIAAQRLGASYSKSGVV
ncbi:MAG: hypothetical protein NXI32_09290 [bacterium]|nr:hypothetical protein [bacterium]